ncbi:YihY/virulence factor BrkB family protein [Paenisporosarcina sp. FSL H8-0542]|uniref:YihY/virulence factor BrkB family protein n=1 Tax=unclassified Paenisporosarcina TaxID=2642018 RepID=UPI00034E0CDF|nr:YihY/virulence factor BrkB family protein [Paenisporosarcina sp. HGH0030]EPD49416.1 YihY family inner membrane protein [Paenisporosarcina sp. HGH0030]
MKLVTRIFMRFFSERFFDEAAQTAYYLLLSVFPFLLFILSLISFFPVDEQQILNFLRPFAPGESFNLIEDNVTNILAADKGRVLSLSLLAAFWVSSMAVQALARALNEANGIKSTLPYWKGLLRDLGITLLFMTLIPLSLFLPFIESGLHWVVSKAGTIDHWQGWIYIWPAVKWGLGSVFLFLFFLLFYKIVPNKRLTFRDVWPGALLSAVGWQVVSILFADYVANVNYKRLYGQLSGIIVLVLWFYLTTVVILLSGLLIAEVRKLRLGSDEGVE